MCQCVTCVGCHLAGHAGSIFDIVDQDARTGPPDGGDRCPAGYGVDGFLSVAPLGMGSIDRFWSPPPGPGGMPPWRVFGQPSNGPARTKSRKPSIQAHFRRRRSSGTPLGMGSIAQFPALVRGKRPEFGPSASPRLCGRLQAGRAVSAGHGVDRSVSFAPALTRGTTGRPTRNAIGLNFEFSRWTHPPPKGGIASPARGRRRSQAHPSWW